MGIQLTRIKKTNYALAELLQILPYIAITRIEELFENGFFRFWDGDTQTKRTVQVVLDQLDVKNELEKRR